MLSARHETAVGFDRFRNYFIDPFTSHDDVLLDCRIWRDVYTVVECMFMKLMIPKIDMIDGF